MDNGTKLCLLFHSKRAGLGFMNLNLRLVIGWTRMKINPDKMEIMLTRGSVDPETDVQPVLNRVVPLRFRIWGTGTSESSTVCGCLGDGKSQECFLPAVTFSWRMWAEPCLFMLNTIQIILQWCIVHAKLIGSCNWCRIQFSRSLNGHSFVSSPSLYLKRHYMVN